MFHLLSNNLKKKTMRMSRFLFALLVNVICFTFFCSHKEANGFTFQQNINIITTTATTSSSSCNNNNNKNNNNNIVFVGRVSLSKTRLEMLKSSKNDNRQQNKKNNTVINNNYNQMGIGSVSFWNNGKDTSIATSMNKDEDKEEETLITTITTKKTAKIKSTHDKNQHGNNNIQQNRRSMLLTLAAAAAATGGGGIMASTVSSSPAMAAETATAITNKYSSSSYYYYYYPNWLALPVFPFSQRKTLRREIVPGMVWTFDQLIGIYYVHVPIRMTVVALGDNGNNSKKGLLVYAPVAATQECLTLLQELIDEYGPIRYIVLPSVAVEHKVLAGPFAKKFPNAEFYLTNQQYSFPINLPDRTLGLPSWAKPLPESSSNDDNNNNNNNIWGGEFEHEVLTIKPGVGSMYQDVALFHKRSKTLLVCDALFATTTEPPPILQNDPDYVKALLFHARDTPNEIVKDTPEARQKGWRRIVLLFNFFFPLHSANIDLGIRPLLNLNWNYPYGWAGWMPFSWKSPEKELESFNAYSANGKPTIYTIVQIILSRGNSGEALQTWVDKITKWWDFERVIPQHLDAPLNIGPKQFAETFAFVQKGENEVRYCDDDVEFLRKAEEGPLNFSVYKSRLGVLRGQSCDG